MEIYCGNRCAVRLYVMLDALYSDEGHAFCVQDVYKPCVMHEMYQHLAAPRQSCSTTSARPSLRLEGNIDWQKTHTTWCHKSTQHALVHQRRHTRAREAQVSFACQEQDDSYFTRMMNMFTAVSPTSWQCARHSCAMCPNCMSLPRP